MSLALNSIQPSTKAAPSMNSSYQEDSPTRFINEKSLKSLIKTEKTQLRGFVRRARKVGTELAVKQAIVRKISRFPIFENKKSLGYEESDSSDDYLGLYDRDEQTSFKPQKEESLGKWLLSPDGTFKSIWDNLNLIFILYVAIVLPFKLAFLSQFQTTLIWTISEYLVDLFFLLDILVTFFTPVCINFQWTTTHWRIAKKYLSFWFWLDLFSVIPWSAAIEKSFIGIEFLTTFLKIPRIYKLMKLTRLSRTLGLNKNKKSLLSKIIKSYSSQLVSTVLPLYLSVFLLAHIFACLWYYQAIVLHSPLTWLARYDFTDEQLFDRYMASLYYVYTTLTTTGYGDIVPATNIEFLFTICCMGIGVTFHSLIYTHMLTKFAKASESELFFSEKFDLLQKINRQDKHKLFQGSKGRKIFREINTVIKEHKKHDHEEIPMPSFQELPQKDRNSLMLEIAERYYRFDTLTFFKSVPEKLWVRFFENMKKETYIKGNIIFEKGGDSKAFYVIRKGKVMFMSRQDDTKEKPFMTVDSYFGEFEIFGKEGSRRRRWTVVAKKKTVVYSISRGPFLNEILYDNNLRKIFLGSMKKRIQEFEKAERQCCRALRRHQRARTKLDQVQNTEVNRFQRIISKIKKKHGKEWHGKFESTEIDDLNSGGFLKKNLLQVPKSHQRMSVQIDPKLFLKYGLSQESQENSPLSPGYSPGLRMRNNVKQNKPKKKRKLFDKEKNSKNPKVITLTKIQGID